MERRDLARAIQSACYLEGTFILRSGRVASHYFDKYQFESSPTLLTAVCEQMLPLIPEGVDVLAGLELGGVPVVTELSRLSGIPAAFIRKQRKEHGTARLAEGADMSDRNVLIVEDVVTSGGQISLSTADIRAEGAVVTAALCVIDREDGGTENLREAGLSLISLFVSSELLSES